MFSKPSFPFFFLLTLHARAFLICSVRAACLTHVTLLDLSTLIIGGIWRRIQILKLLITRYSAASSSIISRTVVHMTNQVYSYSKCLRSTAHVVGYCPLVTTPGCSCWLMFYTSTFLSHAHIADMLVISVFLIWL